ncbi:zinc-binding alcohol dehydrogenase family protein [Devosia enhydra]|nr:zinc-binding alcohol dehydrogenase family protein [Devosia enhydra]
MRALVCAEPGQLAIATRAIPQRGPDEVLVRVRRVGICGTDYHIFEGKHPFLAYPRVMGHELAAEVVEAPEGSPLVVGEAVIINPYLACGTCIACRKGSPNCCTRIAVLGVHTDGGMADYLVLPETNVISGNGLNLDQCAAVEFLAIGAHAVRRGGVGPGDRALVIGAGPIGLGAALFARLSGATVHLLDRDAERLASIGAIVGAAGTIRADEGMDAAVAAATDGEGFDVVFDATGVGKSMEKAFDHVAATGRLVLVSVVKDPITFSDPDFHRREMTLIASRNATAVDFERVAEALRSGAVPIDQIVTHRTSLQGAIADLPRWAREKSGLIKALVTLD